MKLFSFVPRLFGVAAVAAAGLIFSGSSLLLNHPVLVEGNCLGPGAAQRVIVLPGTCGDWDGDGRIGTAEDVDEGDRVFGTITAALGPGVGPAAGTGANQNGMVTIIESGDFAETVIITSANGNVTLQGAPGVKANIDAVVQGVAGGAARQLAPGIIVDAPDSRYVVLRNLTVRNWAEGIRVLGASHAAIEEVRVENNANWGVRAQGDARVTVAKAEVHATGRRVGAGTDFPGTSDPMPGTGIEYEDNASGTVFFTTVSGSFAAGISNAGRGRVCVSHVNVFDNNPNLRRISHGDDNNSRCEGRDRDDD